MTFPTISDDLRMHRLAPPVGRSRVILDTDIANEIDDPFAIAHALLSPDQIDLRAITIAPYANASTTAAESQVRSAELGEQTLAFMPRKVDLVPGATRMTGGAAAPSPAVDRILAESRDADPLFILAIGAATNVASALLIDPTLVERSVVVWLGGHIPEYPRNDEYNLNGDRFASQTLFRSGVPLIQYPALGVTSHLTTSYPAALHDLGDSAAGAFFATLLRDYPTNQFGMEKELWDVGVTSYLVNPAWTNFVLEPTPLIGEDCRYEPQLDAPLYKRATFLARNAIIPDLYRKIHGL